MQENQNIILEIVKNIPVIVTGLTAIFTALITGLITWLISKKQYEAKILELKGQSELRAREHLFNTYQKNIENIVQMNEEFFKSMGNLYGEVIASSEENKSQQFLDSINKFKNFFILIDDPILTYEEKLKEQDLLTEKMKSKLLESRELLKNLQKGYIEPGEAEELFLNIFKLVAIFNSVESELLDKKSKDLFQKYMND